MRRLVPTLAIAVAFATALASQPAVAHAAWHVTAFQYVVAGVDGVGSGGSLNTPAGPVEISEGFVDDGIGSIANRDPVNHSFTECTGDCDTTRPSSTGARFDITLPPSSSATGADIDLLNAVFEGREGEWLIFCRFHPSSMRARLRTTGG